MYETKALIGQKAICDYLQIGKTKFYEVIETEIPIVKTDIGWLSHKDLLDEFLKKHLSAALKKK